MTRFNNYSRVGTRFVGRALILFSLIRLACPDGYPNSARTAPKTAMKLQQLDLMPVPSQVSWENGRLILTPQFAVGITGPADSRVEHAIQRTLNRLEERTGLKFLS